MIYILIWYLVASYLNMGMFFYTYYRKNGSIENLLAAFAVFLASPLIIFFYIDSLINK